MNITDHKMPSVSAIVPARNEQATIAACIESLAQQPEITEILVVNDQSTDATGEIVQQLLPSYPQLRLLQTTSLPPGWVGKNHAVWQGARVSRGDWLLFTDADVIQGPASARKALQVARASACVPPISPSPNLIAGGPSAAANGTETGGTAIPGCASFPLAHPQLISFSPEQITETWYEKSLIPVVYCRLSKLFDFAAVNDPQNPSAAANGQFLLVSREAYNAVGGHAAVAGEVLEDVALAQLVKQAGYGIWFGSGTGIVRVRMYRSFAAMWEGWRKNLYRLIGAHPSALLAEISYAVIPLLVSLLVIGFIWVATKDWRAGLFSTAVAFAVWHPLYRRELRRNHYANHLIWYGIPGKILYAAVLWASYRAHQKGTLAWKGREYPVGTPRASNEAAKR